SHTRRTSDLVRRASEGVCQWLKEKLMPACRTCTHPERERIEFAIANCIKGQHGAMSGIAAKYGIPRASLERHRDRHMTQDQMARLRFNAPDATDQKIEDVIRQEG